jgi:hypothetical protein
VEKLLFLFPRKHGLTRQEFFDHYLDVHAPLGLSLTRTMRHYVVNLHDGVDTAPDGVDAFTETWTDSIADFMDVEASFASPADAQRLMADHDSFIGDPYSAYSVEEHVAMGAGRDTQPSRALGSGAKAIVHVTTDDARDAVVEASLGRDGVTGVVENRVTAVVMPGSPAAVSFVSVWSTVDVVGRLEAAAGAGGVVYSVSEHVQK